MLIHPPFGRSIEGKQSMGQVPRYEIFQKLPNEPPTWVENAHTLDQALVWVKHLVAKFSAEYFVLDTEKHVFITDFANTAAIDPSTERQENLTANIRD